MKKTVLLSLPLLSLLSQADTLDLGSVNISSTTSAVNEQSILSAKALDLGTLLSNEDASINYNRKGAMANDIILRSFQKDNLNVLLDNQKIYGACPNRMDPPAFHVSSQSIASIEVQKGPFDVHQSGSLGGKVNVTTKEPQKDFASNARIDYGSFNYYGASGDITGGNELVQYYLALSYQQSDAYKDGDSNAINSYDLGKKLPNGTYANSYKQEELDKSAYKVGTVLAKLNITPTKDSTVRLHVAYDKADGVIYPGLKMDADYDNTTRYGLEYEQANLGTFSDTLTLTYSHADIDHLMSDERRNSSMMRVDKNVSYGMQTDAQSSFDNVELVNSAYIADTKIDIGLNLSRRNWVAKNHINLMKETLSAMMPDVNTDNLGAFIDANYMINSIVELQGGIRYDFYSTKANDSLDFLSAQRPAISDTKEEAYPSAYIKTLLHVNSTNDFFIALGHSARVADPQEKYMQLQRPMTSPNWLGNPDLEAVKNSEADIGYSLKTQSFTFDATLFYSYLKDYIYLYNYTQGSKNAMSYTNIDATIYGGDIQARYALTQALSTKAGISYQRGEKVTQAEGNTNTNLAEIPPLKGLVSLIYEAHSFYGELQGIGADKQSNIDENLGEKEIDGYLVAHLKLGYKFSPSWQLFGELDNIFDTTYAVNNAYVRDPFSSGAIINEPGRSAYVNLSYRY